MRHLNYSLLNTFKIELVPGQLFTVQSPLVVIIYQEGGEKDSNQCPWVDEQRIVIRNIQGRYALFQVGSSSGSPHLDGRENEMRIGFGGEMRTMKIMKELNEVTICFILLYFSDFSATTWNKG